jgi:hypothetical protein
MYVLGSAIISIFFAESNANGWPEIKKSTLLRNPIVELAHGDFKIFYKTLFGR